MARHNLTKKRAQHATAAQHIAPRWLTLAGATAYAGMSGQTLRNWARAGHLTLHRVSPMGERGRTLIDRLQLDALIEAYAGAPAADLTMNSGKGASARP